MNRRRQIQLSPDEQAAFFRKQRKAALATLDQDGFPHVVAMNYLAKDGAFYFGFPTGMEIVNAIDSRPTPWFWAVNGAAGVLAAGTAVLVSIHATISTTLWCGAACYLLLAPIAINLARLRRNEPDVVAMPAASG